MPQQRVELEVGQVLIRHVQMVAKPAAWTADGDFGVYKVLGAYFRAADIAGVNGPNGWQDGWYQPTLNQAGQFSITLPNKAGSDGQLHRDRFAVLTGINPADPTNVNYKYRIGDEWLEVFRVQGRRLPGEPLFIGTPVSAEKNTATITITGVDALWLPNKQREFAAAFWRHAPRDVIEHYCKAWSPRWVEDFETTGRFTYSSSSQTTADGRSTYINVQEDSTKPGTVLLRPPAASTFSVLQAANTTPAAIVDRNGAAWRAEIMLTRGRILAGGSIGFDVALAPGALRAAGQITVNDTQVLYSSGNNGGFPTGGSSPAVAAKASAAILPPVGTPFTLAIEKREGYLYFYLDNRLLGIIQAPREADFAFAGDALPVNLTTRIYTIYPSGGTVGTDGLAWVHYAFVRQADPLLLRPSTPSQILGDMRLPGKPTDDGLLGEYFDDHDIAYINGATPQRETLTAARKPIARRIDQAIEFNGTVANQANGFLPIPVSFGEHCSARWTGSVYLDLDNYDYAFRFYFGDRVRMWIGDTRAGQEYIYDWTTSKAEGYTYGTWLKAGNTGNAAAPSGSTGKFVGQGSGYYPIVIEWGQFIGSCYLQLGYIRSDASAYDNSQWQYANAGTQGVPSSGRYLTPAASRLRFSSQGIYNQNPRFDSHAAQIDAVQKAFGLQFICEPMHLESGNFPGRVVPKVRVGRDTNYEVTRGNSVDVKNTVTAEDTADTLFLDAQGIADDGQAAQVIKEGVDFTQLGQHMAIQSDHDSVSDITIPTLAAQRAASLQTLRGDAWEELTAQPEQGRAFVDTFALPNTPAEFSWEPGDGVLRAYPELGVVDSSPTQITTVKRTIVPAGVGKPQGSFRQRPRSGLVAVRDALRRGIVDQRTYQGQIVKVTGNWAAIDNAGNVTNSGYSLVGLPINPDDLIKAEVVIGSCSGGSWNLLVNDVDTGLDLANVTRIDITAQVKARYSVIIASNNNSIGNPERRAYVRFTYAGGAAGGIQYTIELTVRV